jgi:hypothetical protein
MSVKSEAFPVRLGASRVNSWSINTETPSRWPGILMSMCPGGTGSSVFGVSLNRRLTVSRRVGTLYSYIARNYSRRGIQKP